MYLDKTQYPLYLSDTELVSGLLKGLLGGLDWADLLLPEAEQRGDELLLGLHQDALHLLLHGREEPGKLLERARDEDLIVSQRGAEAVKLAADWSRVIIKASDRSIVSYTCWGCQPGPSWPWSAAWPSPAPRWCRQSGPANAKQKEVLVLEIWFSSLNFLVWCEYFVFIPWCCLMSVPAASHGPADSLCSKESPADSHWTPGAGGPCLSCDHLIKMPILITLITSSHLSEHPSCVWRLIFTCLNCRRRQWFICKLVKTIEYTN